MLQQKYNTCTISVQKQCQSLDITTVNKNKTTACFRQLQQIFLADISTVPVMQSYNTVEG